MATKKAPPRRNTDVIRCEKCGEEYSTTYKRCPFCDERPSGRSYPPVGGGRRVAGGGRSSRTGQPNPLQVGGLVLSLVLIIAAVVIVFTTLSPLLFGSNPSGGSHSQSSGGSTPVNETTIQALTLSRTEASLQAGEPYRLIATPTPEDAQVTVTWTSSNENIATVDEFGNVTNVYKGSDQAVVTITASAGGQTATCTVTCAGDGTGENIPSGGETEPSGGETTPSTGGTLAPNTEAVITGATGGLNIRSGPGTNYSVQASTTNGATVRIIEAAENGWYHIEYATGGGNYEEGYVLGDYLAPSNS